jgi:DUF1009 family protein
MPAAEKKLDSITRLGVFAGSGQVPRTLLHACDRRGIETFVLAVEGHTDPQTLKGREYAWVRLGAAGKILKTLRAHEITDLVLIGAIKRPSWLELKPDLKAALLLLRLAFRSVGDSNLLSMIRAEFEKEGFTLHGVHAFADDLLTRKGPVGAHQPNENEWSDIVRGFTQSQHIGQKDIGQAVVVQEGAVLGVEGPEGTDELIRRCRVLQKNGKGGILVKSCKPQQDRDMDLPTIGPETALAAAQAGFAGIAVHAGASLLIDPEKVAEIADKHKMFVIGIDPQEVEGA